MMDTRRNVTREGHRVAGLLSLLLILALSLFGHPRVVEAQQAQSKISWITINSNRFCCEYKKIPLPTPVPGGPPAPATPAPAKTTADQDTSTTGLSGLQNATRVKLDLYDYRPYTCSADTICASYPPFLTYTGLCRDKGKAEAKILKLSVATPVDDETERCRIFNELKPNVAETLPRRRIMVLNDDTSCVFRIHYALTDELAQGFKVFTTYFTERAQVSVKDDLNEPSTKEFFTETTIGETKNIFGFPYFLVIRVECEEGGFYGDEVYNFPVNGNSLSTSITINYKSFTSRQEYQNSLRMMLEAVFVNLDPGEGDNDKDNDLVPKPYTPHMKDPDTGEDICQLKVCYPAFMIPLPFLKIPIFEVVIREHRAVARIARRVYSHPFHKRESGGLPPLEIAGVFGRHNLAVDYKDRKYVETTLLSPRYFFPANRHGDYDTDLDVFPEPIKPEKVCLVPEQFRLQGEFGIPPTFYLSGKEEKRIYAMENMDEMKSHLPLTQDDFYMAQYTHGTAPVVAIAGFHRPDLVLFGNPEMSQIELIQWSYNQAYETTQKGAPEPKRIFFTNVDHTIDPKMDVTPDCLSTANFLKDPEQIATPTSSAHFQKPMYSEASRGTESCYGRRQYYPMNYALNTTLAIFEILSMEDRLLLKTANGLVPLYGYGSVTIGKDIVLHAVSNETLRRCFKFVRISNNALMEFDPILAVTYSYTETSSGILRDQEVWFGKLIKAGEPIEWTEIGASEYDDSRASNPLHISPAISNTGTTTDIPEAVKICKQVFEKHIIPIFEVGFMQNTVEFDHREKEKFKCVILDGASVPTRPHAIQLLVEMTFRFYKDKDCKPSTSPLPSPKCDPYLVEKCSRYLYCVNLITESNKVKTASPKPIVDRVGEFLKRVEPQRCERNFNAMLLGLYDGITKDYSLALSTVKQNFLQATPVLSDVDYCKTEVMSGTTFQPEENHCDPWEIVGIYPRRACKVPHLESIRIIVGFDKSYFGLGTSVSGSKPAPNPTTKLISCFELGKAEFEADLFINRMTYSRQINLNLFLYGNSLLHTVDGGRSITHLRGFPEQKFGGDLDYDMLQINNRHVIKIMTFGNNGQFAFLTSYRELWLGNSGSLRLIRIRPSGGYSMMYLSLFKDRPTIAQGIPFTVMYDSYNELFELVVIPDTENHAQEIVKRHIDTELIMRNEFTVRALHSFVNEEMMEKENFDILTKDPKSGAPPAPPSPPGVPIVFTENGVSFSVSLQAPGPSCVKSFGCLKINFAIERLTLHCPYSQMRASQNYSKTLNRLQQFIFLAPFQHQKIGLDYKQGALMAYQASTFSLVFNSFLRLEKERKRDDFYSRVPRDTFDKWRLDKLDETHIGLLHYLRGDPHKTGVLVDPRSSNRDLDPNDSTKDRFLQYYWLNYNQTVELIVTFYIKNAHLLSKTDFKIQKLSEIQLNIDNANGRLVQLETERVILAKYAAVQFIVWIKLIKNATLLKQNEPGQGLIPVPLTFHLIGAFGRCFDLAHWGTVGESITATVFAGCPPASGILFDWNSTLNSLAFKDEFEKYGNSSYCHNREFVCFFAREAITFNFDVLDSAKQRYVPFQGIYKLKIVGGGRTKSEIVAYNDEEIEAYNVQGKSDVSLIWTLALVQPDEIKVPVFEDIGKDPITHETLLMAGISRIKWVCNTLSPCARIAPRSIVFKTIYYFKVEITNEGVDAATLCKHKLVFIIMLYGFPPSPEMLLLTTLIFCFLLLLFMYIMFVCCRRNRKVWRAHKLKLSGWFRIIIDTFPKPMKKKANDVDDQTRKDSILLSLQGHLKVPEVILRKREGSPPSDEDLSIRSSNSSITSQSYSEVLPEVKARKAAATWTDMVYEQIISRRLLSIVERNKRMREQILKKAMDAEELGDLPASSSRSSADLDIEKAETAAKKPKADKQSNDNKEKKK